MKCKRLLILFLATLSAWTVIARHVQGQSNPNSKAFNPSTYLWYTAPAAKWDEALPVGNGRLGAMVFGAVAEERLQLNEETYWSGGPYSTVVRGGYKVLPHLN